MQEFRVLCLDVDGVLTDGRIYVDPAGQPIRAFNIQDGLAIEWFQRLGGTVIILTGKQSSGVEHRARELGIRHVVQGSRDKLADLRRVLSELGGTLEDTAAVGDDLPDLPVLRNCGYAIAVANAVAEVKREAQFITQARGGHGAVREAIEHLMQRGGHWQSVVEHYANPGGAVAGRSAYAPINAEGG